MRSQDEENEQKGMYDEDENHLFKNTDANGRFHSDWCSMIYYRLMLARDLLSDDGIVLGSIDEHEHINLLSIMNEIFGESNYVDSIVWDKKSSAKGVPPRNMMVNVHEYIVDYQKSNSFRFVGEKRDKEADVTTIPEVLGVNLISGVQQNPLKMRSRLLTQTQEKNTLTHGHFRVNRSRE